MDQIFDPQTIAVIRGGDLHRDHSLKTGGTFLNALRAKFARKEQPDAQIKDIYIDAEGNWHLAGFRTKPHEALEGVDLAVNAMHGEYGADGKLQRLLESLGIKYTGSGSSESAISAHHGWLKRAHAQSGIQAPRYLLLSSEEDPRERASYIFNHFHMPIVLMPTRFGRRNEALFAQRYDLLPSILEDFLGRHGTAVAEQYIEGRHLIVPVLDQFRGQEQYVPVIVERNKQAEAEVIVSYIQAQGLTEEVKTLLNKEAVRAHKDLGYRHVSQQHFVLTPRGKAYIVDSESHPPIHDQSPIGVAFSALGADPETVASHIADLALA
jgi:D-alanine-D-alanine ligase